jgi:hypothetical protein
MPNAVSTKGKITVYGAGFTPGALVTVGLPHLPLNGKLKKGLWIGVADVNEYGAFSLEVGLARTTGFLARKKQFAPKLYGIHTLLAYTENEAATTPLIIKKAEAKKKK